MKFLGVDTGGTFTDFVLYDAGRLSVHKVLSTPEAPERAILQGIHELGLDPGGLAIVHGSTVATNAVLEGKGVRTLYITNQGLGDVLTIGRQARRALYNLQPPPVTPPVPAELCLETGGRLGADGRVVEPLSEEELRQLCDEVQRLNPEAVAINLLFSWLDDRFEQAIAARLPAGLFISRSTQVLAEQREYERGIATWLNSWVGPLVQRYLIRLQQEVGGAQLAVMQSAGTTIDANQAGRQAVRMLLSGPAGGLAGAQAVAALAGREQLLTFDMGGTSTDVALIDGALRLTSEGSIGPWPVAVPMVDMHTIGAGGGSIAYIDAGGMLQVGPESAGASPGPACYGRGGIRPTVTDANLVLGRLRADAFLGGGMRLDSAAARAALLPLAKQLHLTIEQLAEGVVRIADEHMVRALRVTSVQRGVDPRGLTLVSFGGAGGLHVCALAEALGMRQALVPLHAGVLSALGMLVARRGRHLSRSLQGLLTEIPEAQIEKAFAALIAAGAAQLEPEGVRGSELDIVMSVDLRYHGQSYTLSIPWEGCRASAMELFHEAHQNRYGHRLALPVELVTLRASVQGPQPPIDIAATEQPTSTAPQWVRLHGVEEETLIRERSSLLPGTALDGPALITETISTTWLAPGWRARRDALGNLLLERQE
ncbi:MAG TPA: hydantoinase/oxoprolinase family protein [Gammaproteobacteria bacterium]